MAAVRLRRVHERRAVRTTRIVVEIVQRVANGVDHFFYRPQDARRGPAAKIVIDGMATPLIRDRDRGARLVGHVRPEADGGAL